MGAETEERRKERASERETNAIVRLLSSTASGRHASGKPSKWQAVNQLQHFAYSIYDSQRSNVAT